MDFFIVSLYERLYLALISKCLCQLGFIFLLKLHEVLFRKQLILFNHSSTARSSLPGFCLQGTFSTARCFV